MDTFRRQITVTDDVGGALDAPILVLLGPDRIDYTKALADGSDVHFRDASGVILDHELERWSPDGESIFWVRLPTISAGTTFALHYGGAALAPGEPMAVWPDYDLVYHFADAATDSSPRGFDGMLENGAASGRGLIGNGVVLAGDDDRIDVGTDLNLLRAVT